MQQLMITQLITKCDGLLTSYRRLDYEHRDEVRYPFSSSEWPQPGQPWDYARGELFRLNARMQWLELDVTEVWTCLKWKQQALLFFNINEHTAMVDVLPGLQQLSQFLQTKLAALE